MERDALVVGGGPAGLSFAIGAARRGLRVTVIDRAHPPIDKACGEGLMPDGVACLSRQGVDLAGLGRPFRGIRYLDGETVAEGSFRGRPGLGLRRLQLHQALASSAQRAGVELVWGLRVEGLTGDPDRGPVAVTTPRGVLSARWIVGADGLRSRMRRWAGLEGRPARNRRFGVRRHYRIPPWTDRVEVYWAPGCEAYVTPVAAEEVGVALLWGEAWGGGRPGFDRLLATFPALERRLGGAPHTSRDRGLGPLEQRARAPYRGRVALLGDASGYLDAITGEGLSLAFHQAVALAEALVAGDLRRYAAATRRLRRTADGMTRLLLALERRPPWRRRLVATLAADPALFSRLLAIHCRELPLSGLGLGGVARLAGGLLVH